MTTAWFEVCSILLTRILFSLQRCQWNFFPQRKQHVIITHRLPIQLTSATHTQTAICLMIFFFFYSDALQWWMNELKNLYFELYSCRCGNKENLRSLPLRIAELLVRAQWHRRGRTLSFRNDLFFQFPMNSSNCKVFISSASVLNKENWQHWRRTSRTPLVYHRMNAVNVSSLSRVDQVYWSKHD